MGFWKKIWHFIWYEDSLASWLVNLVLAFVIVKWVIYPLIGLVFSTQFPIVAVVSGSMDHQGLDFDAWWEQNKAWYEEQDITQEEFADFPFKNGFVKGDIMFLKGVEPQTIKVGTVLVYESSLHGNPIIHRVVAIEEEDDGYHFVLKGDNNSGKDGEDVTEKSIERTGKAIAKIPFLGWFKIWLVELLQ